MSSARHTPVVPLEAGAGPENPPCPACGEPLFGWLAGLPGSEEPVRRCESCGLAVVGKGGGVEEALAALDRLGGPEAVRIANRNGVACALGNAGWAGLEPGLDYLFSVESARRLVAHRDQVVKRARWSPGAGLAAMWQTLLNSVTFGHNVALGALGAGRSVKAQRPWQRGIDAVVSVIGAIPALVIALPIELVAGLGGRGAVVSVRFELL
jgi:hypothetical protein